MSKRYSSNTINSNESFAALLAAQERGLSELQGVRKILELSQKNQEKAEGAETLTQRIQVDILGQLKEHTKIAKASLKSDKDMEEVWKRWDKNRADALKGMQTYKSMGESWSEKMAGLREKFSPSGIKRSVLNATNVFGINNKALEFDQYKVRQKALGADQDGKKSNKDWKADYEEMRAMRRKSNELERKINAIVSRAGEGQTEETVLAAHGEGSEFHKLLKQRNGTGAGKDTLDRAETVERSLKRFDPSGISPEPKSVTNAEDKEETERRADEQNEILKKIEENTKGLNQGGEKKVSPTSGSAEGEGGGFLSNLLGGFGDGLGASLKKMFSPKNILKFLGKAAIITTVLGSLFEGITDGFSEYMKTGSIGKALVAGFAGIIDFLTFGLFDKEKIKETMGDMGAWLSEHVITPFTKWIGEVKDSFSALISNIGVPEIKFKLPGINKEVSIGPFYPFKSDTQATKASAVAPTTSANVIEQRSAENDGLKSAPASNGNTVISAPTTNTNNNTTNIIRAPIRNRESSAADYTRTVFA